jgi:hypothetical protein
MKKSGEEPQSNELTRGTTEVSSALSQAGEKAWNTRSLRKKLGIAAA